jgi:hypothetical protein
LTAIAYRRGKYVESIYYGAKTAALRCAASGLSARLLAAGLDAAFKLRNRGNHRFACLAFAIAGMGWRRCTFKMKRDYAMNVAWFKVLDTARFSGKRRLLEDKIHQTAYLSLSRGAWGTFYVLKNFAEDRGVDIDPQYAGRAAPMPSSLGFRHLGNLPAYLETFWTEDVPHGASFFAIKRRLALARAAGLNPDLWKCALTAMEKGGPWLPPREALPVRQCPVRNVATPIYNRRSCGHFSEGNSRD